MPVGRQCAQRSRFVDSDDERPQAGVLQFVDVKRSVLWVSLRWARGGMRQQSSGNNNETLVATTGTFRSLSRT